MTHCFTSAYGRSPVRSGSYVSVEGGLRRFSPAEIITVDVEGDTLTFHSAAAAPTATQTVH